MKEQQDPLLSSPGLCSFPSVYYYIVHWDSSHPDQGLANYSPGAKSSLYFYAYELRIFFFFTF